MPSDPRKPKYALPARLESMLAIVSEYLAANKQELLQRVLVNASYSVHEEWSYDNWNGGTVGHAIAFHVPRSVFTDLIGHVEELAERLCKTLNEVNSLENEFIEKVFLEVEAGKSEDWRAATGALLPRDSAGAVLSVRTDPELWAAGHFRLFVSHVSTSKADANNLKKEFAWYGVSAFVAHEDIQPTAVWQREIERALATMNAMLAMATPGFRDSHWCQQEAGWALGRGVPIIGLRSGEDPPGFIAANQALSAGIKKHGEIAKEVVKLLARETRSASLIREALVSKIEGTESWEWLRELIDCVVVVPKMPREQLDRLEQACVANEHLKTNRSLPLLTAFIRRQRAVAGG